jgi:hypothetical protein
MRIGFFEVKDWERTFLAERLPSDDTSFDSGALKIFANGSSELEALARILEVTLANLEAFRAGQAAQQVA